MTACGTATRTNHHNGRCHYYHIYGHHNSKTTAIQKPRLTSSMSFASSLSFSFGKTSTTWCTGGNQANVSACVRFSFR